MLRQMMVIANLGAANEAATAEDIAAMANDGMAELCRQHPDRFPSFVASLPMNNVKASLDEMDYAIRKLGVTGKTDTQHTSLIESFLYPKYGPGQMWETAAAEFERRRDEGRARVNLIAQEMAAQGTILAHFVEAAERAGMAQAEINRRLKAITDDTTLDEIWITDEKGHAYLRSIPEVDFTFSDSQRAQPQAYTFYDLLTGKKKLVDQEARKRDIDDQQFKYVGVGGVVRAVHVLLRIAFVVDDKVAADASAV